MSFPFAMFVFLGISKIQCVCVTLCYRNLHNGHSRSQSFIAGNKASVQQQQLQIALREPCMFVHHSNIEIDSNDSLFFLRKTRESKKSDPLSRIGLTHLFLTGEGGAQTERKLNHDISAQHGT